MTSLAELAALAETAEAHASYVRTSHASAAVRDGLGLAATRLGGATVLSARLDPSGQWSRASGLGATEPVTPELVDEVVGFYRAQGTPTALLAVAPPFLPEDWDEIRAAHGLEPDRTGLKMGAPVDDLRTGARTDLRVSRLDEEEAAEAAHLVARTIGMEHPGVVALLASAAGTPGTQVFGAWDDDRLVATGSLFVHGTTASLKSGVTAVTHRGRGAQSALVAVRIAAARAAGARWVGAETDQAAPGEHNPSTANLERAGLEVLYARQDWRWRA